MKTWDLKEFTYINQLKTLIYYYQRGKNISNEFDNIRCEYYSSNIFAVQAFLNRYDTVKYHLIADQHILMLICDYWPETYFSWNNKHSSEELNKDHIKNPYGVKWER